VTSKEIPRMWCAGTESVAEYASREAPAQVVGAGLMKVKSLVGMQGILNGDAGVR